MANDIGWGQPYDAESGYGMAAVNGAEIGYGTVVLTSYSGETNVSSMDDDNPRDKEVSILSVLPTLSFDETADPTIYVYFLLAEGVTPVSMTGTLYYNNIFYGDATFSTDGLQWMAEWPDRGSYYVDLEIVIDSETTYNFISNTLEL